MTDRPSSNAAGGHSGRPRAARAGDDADTGLPWPRTWRGVYWFVFASFVTYLVLLTWLTRGLS